MNESIDHTPAKKRSGRKNDPTFRASLHIAPEFEDLGHSGEAGGVIIDDVLLK